MPRVSWGGVGKISLFLHGLEGGSRPFPHEEYEGNAIGEEELVHDDV